MGNTKAHDGDVNGIAITKSQDGDLVATCGRDRTIQLFDRRLDKVVLLQTLDDHAAAVTDVMFLDGGCTLVSISSDRTILVRKAAHGEHQSIAYLPIRVITLKSSPLSFASVSSDPNVLVVSTMDRHIHKYDISSGRLVHAFKALDPASNDSVLVTSLQVAAIDHGDEKVIVILAVSSTDKSIRLHDYHSGSLLAREHGQASVSAVRLMRQDMPGHSVHNLISCGLDGTIIVYDVLVPPPVQGCTTPYESPMRAESPLKQNTSSAQPLRKTLTRSEIVEFQKVLEDSHGDTISPIRSPSPARIRKKTSRYTLANPPRGNSTGIGPAHYMSGTNSSQRKSSQDHSPTSASPTATSKPLKPKSRPSLEPRHRSKSVANLNDLDGSAEHLCDYLRTFRTRINSASEKVTANRLKEIERELHLTIKAIGSLHKSTQAQNAGELLSGDLLDKYLAKMIDERLAMRTTAKENLGPTDRDAEDEISA